MKQTLLLLGLISMLFGTRGMAADLDPALQTKLKTQIAMVSQWAADPEIVEAVKHRNQSVPEDIKAMTQEKWAAASPLESFVRKFTQNNVAELLKAKRTEAVAEAFVSDAEGLKVAFLAKPTNWSHKGKPKHEVPMSGKTWQGNVEKDESTGYEQIQVAVPILDAGKPIGSLVVGFKIDKL